VSVGSREWKLSGNSWCEATCAIGLGDIHGSAYEIDVCFANKKGYTGTFEGYVGNSHASLERVDPIARDRDKVSRLVRVESTGDGIRIALTDIPWVESVIGARPDSVDIRAEFGSLWRDEAGQLHEDKTNSWKRRIPVTYRVNAETAQLVLSQYLTGEEEIASERNRTFEPRRVQDIWITFTVDSLVVFRRPDGSSISEREIVAVAGPRLLPLLSMRKPTSFAMCDRTLYYTNVSLFEVDLSTGSERTLYEGLEAHYGRYYDDIVMAPTGRYLAVCYGNGSEFGFLYDLDHRRPVWELGGMPVAWSADGTTLSDSGRFLRVDPTLAWLDEIRVDEILGDQFAALDAGNFFWIKQGKLFMKRAENRSAPPTTLGPISMGRSVTAYPRILGFVGEEMFVHVNGTVFVFDRSGRRREISSGTNVTDAEASLQYIFDER